LIDSAANVSMTAETELFLMNASRAQLVREVIRPSLATGEIVVCDRFYDSTTAYQGYGRGLDLDVVKPITEFAVAGTHPNMTIVLDVSLAVSEVHRAVRDQNTQRRPDRLEASDRSFFERVSAGFRAIADGDEARFRVINGEARSPDPVTGANGSRGNTVWLTRARSESRPAGPTRWRPARSAAPPCLRS
jgi:dTMP kinase